MKHRDFILKLSTANTASFAMLCYYYLGYVVFAFLDFNARDGYRLIIIW